MSEVAAACFQKIAHWAHTRPDALAVTDDLSAATHASLNWRQLYIAASHWARELRQCAPQQRPVVMVQSANRTAFFIAWIGTLLADATIFPVSTSATKEDLRQLAQLAGVTHYLRDGSDSPLAGVPFQPIDSLHQYTTRDEAADSLNHCQGTGSLLLLSSGTTGVSKVVRRDLPALVAVGENCLRAVAMTHNDALAVTTSLAHSYMVDHALMAAMLAGAGVHLMGQFDPLLLAQRIRSTGATILPTVPFVADMMAQTHGVEPSDLQSLRCVYTAGAPLPVSVAQAFEQRFSLRMGQIYGSTEFGSVTFNDPSLSDYAPHLAGAPMQGVSVRIVDRDTPDIHHPLPAYVEGHVAVAAPSMFTHYLGDHDSSLHDGFFLSGDLGMLDEQGRLRLTGRLKLLVDIAGQKVNLIELESLLAQYPGVRDVIVIPVEVTATVSRLKALVVWKDQPGDLQAMRDWARPKLASYKLPRLFETRTDFPRTPTGKIMRQHIQP